MGGGRCRVGAKLISSPSTQRLVEVERVGWLPIECQSAHQKLVERFIERAVADLLTKQVTISFDPGQVTTAQIEAALDDAGYPVAK